MPPNLPATRANPPLPGLLPDVDSKHLIEEIVAFWPDLGPVELRRELTKKDRGVLEQRQRDLNSALRPVSMSTAAQARASQALATMFGAIPSMRNADVPGLISAYLVYLNELPLFAVEQACHDVGSGKVERDSARDWAPASGRLAEMAREKAEPFERERLQVTKTLAGVLAQRPVDPEEERRVGVGLQTFGEQMKEAEDRQRKDISERLGKADLDRNQRLFMDEYKRLGIMKPPTIGGMMISPTLAKKLGVA